MHNFSHQFLFNNLLFLFIFSQTLCTKTGFEYLIFNFIEIPKRQDNEVSPLRIPAANSIHQMIVLIINLQLLEFLCQATTIENCCFSYFSNVFIVQKYFHFWSIRWAQAYIQIPERHVRCVIIIIFASYFPRAMGCWYQYSFHQTYFFLKYQMHGSNLTISIICLVKLILIWQIARHKRQADWHRKWECVVTIFERI